MANSIKKRGQKFVKKFSKVSLKVGQESKEHIKENFIERISHIKKIRLLVLEWTLLVITLMLLAVAQAFWTGDSFAVDTYVEGGTYIEATIGRVTSMNPLFATTSSEKTLSKLMFATLVSNDYTGNPGPGLADRIAHSEDGKVWRVHLRDGLMWSDGEPITNQDILFTVGLVQNPAVSTIFTANLEGVKVEEDENGDVIFNLPAAYADFASALAIPIVPEHVLKDVPLKTLVEANFSKTPVTSGAFSFNATQALMSGSDEVVIYLSANPNYYLGRPMINSFAVHAYKDEEDVVMAMQAGEVTATAELTGDNVGLIANGNYSTRLSPISAGTFAFFNNSRGVLINADMRRAIRQGLDLAKIRDAAPNTTALDYPILDSQITLTSYPAIPSGDFEGARAKVSELAGGETPHLEIATVNSGYMPKVAEALAENLRGLGFECNVSAYAESQEFVTNIVSKRNYDILVYDIELGADPDPLPYYHSSQAKASGLNLSNYRNALVDDLLIGARGTMDKDLRARKYESFLEYWATDVPAIGLYQSNLVYIYNKNVRTYEETNMLVTAIDRFSNIEDWAVNRSTRNQTP